MKKINEKLSEKLNEAIERVQREYCDRAEDPDDCQRFCIEKARCAKGCLQGLRKEVDGGFDPLFQCSSCGLDWCPGRKLEV